jgi:hypothetical protein
MFLLLATQFIVILVDFALVLTDFLGYLRLKEFLHSFIYRVKLEVVSISYPTCSCAH